MQLVEIKHHNPRGRKVSMYYYILYITQTQYYVVCFHFKHFLDQFAALNSFKANVLTITCSLGIELSNVAICGRITHCAHMIHILKAIHAIPLL